jgi:Plavaka transposase
VSKNNLNDYFAGPGSHSRRAGTRFTSAKSLFNIIDQIHYGCQRNEWQLQEFTVNIGGDVHDYRVYFRDPINCIRSIMQHTPFQYHMAYQPVQKYRDNKRVYNEMFTSDWWWEVQAEIPEGGTVIPIIFATDKTKLTNFAGVAASSVRPPPGQPGILIFNTRLCERAAWREFFENKIDPSVGYPPSQSEPH